MKETLHAYLILLGTPQIPTTVIVEDGDFSKIYRCLLCTIKHENHCLEHAYLPLGVLTFCPKTPVGIHICWPTYPFAQPAKLAMDGALKGHPGQEALV